MCLFLRGFRFTDASSSLSGVAAGWVGATWRVVTLDDSMVRPLGAPGRNRRLSWTMVVICLLVVPAGAALLIYLANRSSSLSKVSSVLIGTIIVYFLLLLPIALVGGVQAFSLALSARRSARASSVAVDHTSDVAKVGERIASRARRIMGPRLVVCRVADTQWRSMVVDLVRRSDAIVLDLSRPTENLMWEISLRSAADRRWVYTCHRDWVDTLANPALSPYDSPRHRVATLLAAQHAEVLAYGTGAEELRTFARALRRRLNQSASSRRAPRT
jgi:hypothetical protein